MDIYRRNPLVESFHYDRIKEETGERTLHLSVLPLDANQPNSVDQQTSTIGLQLDFSLEVQRFKVSGSISQINHLKNRIVETQDDLSEQEITELATPLLELVQRLTYEVSEIALNEPGISLAFDQVNQLSS